MLEAYLDESGIHREASWCLVAGFVASSKQWRWFDDRWVSLTAEADFGPHTMTEDQIQAAVATIVISTDRET